MATIELRYKKTFIQYKHGENEEVKLQYRTRLDDKSEWGQWLDIPETKDVIVVEPKEPKGGSPNAKLQG